MMHEARANAWMRRYLGILRRSRSQHLARSLWQVVLLAATTLAASCSLGFTRTACGQILVGSCASRGHLRPVKNVRHRRGWRMKVCGIGLAELADVAPGPPLSSSGLQNRLGLRLPLPQRVALQFEGSANSPQILEASLRNAKGNCVMIEILGVSADALVELQEIDAKGDNITWCVCSSTLMTLPEGACVSLRDITPCSEAPSTATGADGMKNLKMQSSEADPGSVVYNGVGGLQLEGYPRDVDGISCTFTVWCCTGASGSCTVVEDGEDSDALVCEFGPDCIKEGLKGMLPGETRRFWIPAEIEDRRFGRPPPDRYLPGGCVVVDVTLHSITREAVFTYNMSKEAFEFSMEKERLPGRILLRAIGVCVQFLPFAWYIQQQQAGDTFDNLK
mmetsp:Transcript_14462/g.27994  ORF Transcript_14462/g.27994 Transcript_14462/m.27994 type:complete len:391 (+) Transcript_14462:46-1218(+)